MSQFCKEIIWLFLAFVLVALWRMINTAIPSPSASPHQVIIRQVSAEELAGGGNGSSPEVAEYAFNIENGDDLNGDEEGEFSEVEPAAASPLPIRIILMSQSYEDSDKIGGLLKSAFMPNTYYHLDPLAYTDDFRGIDDDNDDGDYPVSATMENLKALLKCKYEEADPLYLKSLQKSNYCLKHNRHAMPRCDLTSYPQFSADQQPMTANSDPRLTALSKVCAAQAGPHVMKVNRARLENFENLFYQDGLDVRLLYLVRDPRAIVASRIKNSAQYNVSKLCKEQEEDYYVSRHLAKLYSERFRAVSYENLLFRPFGELGKIVGLADPNKEYINWDSLYLYLYEEMGIQVAQFNMVGMLTEDANNLPLHQERSLEWIKHLTLEQMKYVQGKCDQALDLWGYPKLKFKI